MALLELRIRTGQHIASRQVLEVREYSTFKVVRQIENGGLLPMITVVNCHYQTPDIYCGRPHKRFAGSPLANPFPMASGADRGRVIAEYRLWLWKQIKGGNGAVLDALTTIYAFNEVHGGVSLGCWCAPKACHCDVIVRALACGEVQYFLYQTGLLGQF